MAQSELKVKLNVRVGINGCYNTIVCPKSFAAKDIKIVKQVKIFYDSFKDFVEYFNTFVGEIAPIGTEILTLVNVDGMNFYVLETPDTIQTEINKCCNINNSVPNLDIIISSRVNTTCSNGITDVFLTLNFSDISLLTPGSVIKLNSSFSQDYATQTLFLQNTGSDCVLNGWNITINSNSNNINPITILIQLASNSNQCNNHFVTIFSISEIVGLIGTYTSNTDNFQTWV